jgi:hypothetical protein
MSFVGMAFSESSARKRLTWTGGGPDGSIFWPLGKAQGMGPTGDTCKEMALGIVFEVRRRNFND